MDILERTIESLTSDEVRRFKILSNRFKADEEKKMLILFDEIRAGDFKTREDEVIEQLYEAVDARTKNSYYRLRNKLLSSLEKSLLFYHFNYKNKIEAYSYLQLALLMLRKNLYREALYDLKKAEKAAIYHGQFNVLENVYDEMIQLAPHTDLDVAAIIERRRYNLKRLEVLRANREVFGMINSELLRRNYGRSKRAADVIGTLEEIKKQLEEHEEVFESAEGKIMIMQTVCTLLIQKSAYAELAQYAKQTLADFEAQGLFEPDKQAERMRLRVRRINALEKLLLIEEAQQEIDLLYQELTKEGPSLYQEYAYHYFSSQAFVLKLRGEFSRAEQFLRRALSEKETHPQSTSKLYLLISLADLYFVKHEHDQARHVLEQLIKEEHFDELDESIQLYIHIFLLVNLFEGKHYEQVEPFLKHIRKTYRSLWRDEFYEHVRRFTDVIVRMATTTLEGRSMHLRAAYRNYQRDFGKFEIGDNEIICYDLYLQAKAEGEDYFALLQAQIPELANL